MRLTSKFAAVCAGVVVLASGTAAFAQSGERVQTESLVYTDPTVAAPGHYLAGASLEFWGLDVPYSYDVGTTSGTVSQSTTVTGYQWGGSLYLGYGDFLLQFEGLTGEMTTRRNAGLVGGGTTPYRTTFPTQQLDLALRYTFSELNWPGITPYLIGGFDNLNEAYTQRLLAPGVHWVSTGTSTLEFTQNYDTPYIGLGLLHEFNNKTGLRFDADIGPSGENLTFESGKGFPNGLARASLRHAHGNLDHRIA